MKKFSYLVFASVLNFLGLKLESMQALSHANIPFLDFFGHVMHFWMLAWAVFIDA